jgi:hypothetical protein
MTHQVTGAAERGVAQHGNKGAVKSVNGGQSGKACIGHALGHH